MLHTYINGAIADLKAIIELTQLDNTDIQSANHEAIFGRLDKKDTLVKAFEEKKSLIHQEMLLLCNKNPNKSLKDLLDDETSDLLDSMRGALSELKILNANYARSVFAVAEFYNSLMKRIVPHESNGYGDACAQSHLLKIQA
ncbi:MULTISPECIES: hypothetical protein [Helicobacter]|uniref:Flagellar protein FlgN n=1 Tax=Helicobacter typhlonius TaxID=76936 RepID=A0A099UFT7_9HELI|nr:MULTISPECIES: hypothetical protein [Helicobacter]TLD79206.1 hypothetical protein LS75_002610 [Helicobacter typhlonius]TLD86107.1 hypothetical protein LS67_008880 [Helicobacter sp. MIT 03-1616]CUU40547.1 FIG00712067: Hypothetical protein [Helicobacter typhlonius]